MRTVIVGCGRVGSTLARQLSREGDDVAVVEYRRHAGASRGGSNFGFADGSVRYIPYPGAQVPFNLWAVTPWYRTNSAAGNFGG